jgi:NadR type nicotinamide-nucleotide adenylyltransferase
MTRGFVLGKFMPPHNGHVYLCEVAQNLVDDLTILVCALKRDPIPGPLRHAWMRELFPRARVAFLDEEVPQEPSEDPRFWDIWRAIVQRFHPEPIDLVFASEDYGMRLASELGARFVPVDPLRVAVPVSATEVRTRPFASWPFIPSPVRAYYARSVCLFGPESSGKTMLAGHLAEKFQTTLVPENGRTYTEFFGTTCSATDLLRIAKTQNAMIAAARPYANRIFFTDTDAVLTSVWSDMLLGRRMAELDGTSVPSDFYLLTDIDFPWVDDGTRYFPDRARRESFFRLCRMELTRRGLPFVTLSGDASTRLATATNAILARWPELAPVIDSRND